MRLLTNNPSKRAGLEGYDLSIVDRVPLPVRVTPDNLRYLTTKRDRMGHDLPGLSTSMRDEHASVAGVASAGRAGRGRAPRWPAQRGRLP